MLRIILLGLIGGIAPLVKAELFPTFRSTKPRCSLSLMEARISALKSGRFVPGQDTNERALFLFDYLRSEDYGLYLLSGMQQIPGSYWSRVVDVYRVHDRGKVTNRFVELKHEVDARLHRMISRQEIFVGNSEGGLLYQTQKQFGFGEKEVEAGFRKQLSEMMSLSTEASYFVLPPSLEKGELASLILAGSKTVASLRRAWQLSQSAKASLYESFRTGNLKIDEDSTHPSLRIVQACFIAYQELSSSGWPAHRELAAKFLQKLK